MELAVVVVVVADTFSFFAVCLRGIIVLCLFVTQVHLIYLWEDEANEFGV